ncbi:phosphate acyltransferase PlsX [bacterium]|nr:phosphate acyltransferase PlsX [bacterium]MBU1154114.1 phosphate acyltransferase PlsX [bacterium]MBU1782097.1 phosphate acyltransferase PlsX [bacterium]MBU2599983.1 phosphate acyltransferase PlsX [bacterium]
MKVIVDAMGGDKGPSVVVKGVVDTFLEKRSKIKEVLLVGREEVLLSELNKYQEYNLPIQVVNASEVITMEESPALAVRSKKDSSMVVAMNLLREKKADALISPGNTGAVMTSALFILGRIKGVSRPGITTLIPTNKGMSVLLDVGANVDCKPKHLAQFALMGHVYAKYILGIKDPSVGLLSIGEEEGKGNILTNDTYRLLKKSSINFIGNVEGRDIINGQVDVIVCDGFVGNTILKFAESLIEMIMEFLKREISKSLGQKLGAFLLKPAFKNLKKRLDHQEYGGAPLLGIKGNCLICHGSSTSKSIQSALKMASILIEQKVDIHIEEIIKEHSGVFN